MMVDIHSSEAFGVEFVAASGHTQPLVHPVIEDVRHAGDSDWIAVRSLEAV